MSRVCTAVSLPRGLTAGDAINHDENAIPLLKAHWKPIGSSTNCFKCKRSFGLVTLPDWCGRCGEIFCKRPCLPKSRRLRSDQPFPAADPEGVLCRVCDKCNNVFAWDNGLQKVGISRSVKSFAFKRSQYIQARRRHQYTNSQHQHHGGDDDVDKLGKLAHAYHAHASKASAITHVAKAMTLHSPQWSKVNWISTTQADKFLTCRNNDCRKKFTVYWRRKFCRVCGDVFCSDCVFNSLLIAFDVTTTNVSMSLLTPETIEPPLSHLLLACNPCLTEAQSQNKFSPSPSSSSPTKALSLSSPSSSSSSLLSSELPDNTPELLACYDRISKRCASVKDSLSKLEHLTLSFGGGGGGGGGGGSIGSSGLIQQLSKYQVDTSTGLSEAQRSLDQLKRLRRYANSECEGKLLQHMFLRWTKLYREYRWQLKDIQKDLQSMIPLEMLSKIALLADIEWLTAAYLYLQQAAVESTAFTFKLLTKSLSEASSGVARELRGALESSGADWGLKEKEMLKFIMLKGKQAPVLLGKTGSKPTVAQLQRRLLRLLAIVEETLHMRATTQSTEATLAPIKQLQQGLAQMLRGGASGGDSASVHVHIATDRREGDVGDDWEIVP